MLASSEASCDSTTASCWLEVELTGAACGTDRRAASHCPSPSTEENAASDCVRTAGRRGQESGSGGKERDSTLSQPHAQRHGLQHVGRLQRAQKCGSRQRVTQMAGLKPGLHSGAC